MPQELFREAGKQEQYLKQRPQELEKLVEIAKIQSTEASNAIEGIVTTSTRIKQLVEEKTAPKNRDEQEIAGYRDVLNIIHESFDAIPITQNYILQLHKILYSHMNNPLAGRTKNVQNYISATYPDGHVETLFTPLAPYETPEALDKICEEYNRVIGNMELEPLIAIPVFIDIYTEIKNSITYYTIPNFNTSLNIYYIIYKISNRTVAHSLHTPIPSMVTIEIYEANRLTDKNLKVIR